MPNSLQEKLEAIVDQTSAHFGVSIKNLQTKEEVNINEDIFFQMASIVKVPILLSLFEKVDHKELSLSDPVIVDREDRVPGSGVIKELDIPLELTIKDLAMLMTIVSDNIATDKLYHLVGKEQITATLEQFHLKDIRIHHSIWDFLCHTVDMIPSPYSEEAYEELDRRLYSQDRKYYQENILREDLPNNLCTPKGMRNLFELLAKEQFINQEMSEEVLDILKRQQLSQRIPGRLPFGTEVAHKTGSMGSVINDAGIVYLPEGRGAYLISVFSAYNKDRNQGVDTIAKISQTAYEHFTYS